MEHRMNKNDYKIIGEALGKVALDATPEQLAILSQFESTLIVDLNNSGTSLDKLDAIIVHRKSFEESASNASLSPLDHL